VTRIDNLLVQEVDGEGVVIVNESSGEEVLVPTGLLQRVWEAMAYFVQRSAPPQDTPYSDTSTEAWESTVEGMGFIKAATEDALPKIKASGLTIQIAPGDDPDAKIAVELGFTVLLGKPIILVVPPGRDVPAGLLRLADRVVFDWDDSEAARARTLDAINSLAAVLDAES
jgi:hypothetical protein